MAETINRGPNVSIGSLMDGRVEVFDGPIINYQGDSVPDPRATPAAKDGLSPSRIPVFFNSPVFVLTDNVPMKTSTTAIAVAAVVTTLVPMALATVQQAGSGAGVPSIGVGIAIMPAGTSIATVAALVLDFGFSTATTVANSTTVAVVDNRIYDVGQWIVIGGAGNAAATRPLYAQVQSIATTNTTAMTIAPAAVTAIANAPVGQGNLFTQFLPPATQFGPAGASAFFTTPYMVGGLAGIFDPAQGISRSLTVQASTVQAGTGTILVSGWDIYGFPMTELVTASGTTSVSTRKAFKYIGSVIPQTLGTTVTATYTIGIGDLFGINMRSDKWEYLNLNYNGGAMVSNVGWTSAITTVANNTTGDVRGTVNGSTIVTIGTSANGTARLVITVFVPPIQMINATPLDATSLFGVTQA